MPIPAPPQFPSPSRPYRGDTFTLSLYDGWEDKTVCTLAGPVTDEFQHNIIVTVDPELEVSTLRDYADWNIESVLEELKACRLLKKDQLHGLASSPA